MKLLCITWIIICEKNKNKISQHLNSSEIQSQNGSKWIPITHINLTAHISALVQKNSLDGVNIPS